MRQSSLLTNAMIYQRFLLLSCVALLLCGCDNRPVKPSPLTSEELAESLGVASFCTDAHFPSARYAQLVATITDSTGKHRRTISTLSSDTDFRLRVLLQSDPMSSTTLKRLSYAIVACNEGGGGQNYIYIEPETSIERRKTDARSTFLYEITLRRHAEKREIHIELATSSTPFAKDAPP